MKVSEYRLSNAYANVLNNFHLFDYSFIVERGGKRLRPYILINVAEGMGIKKREALLYISCAPEILHNATLIHDDIMDKDWYRSGLPNVRKRWTEFLKKEKGFVTKGQKIEEKADFLAINNGDKNLILPFLIISNSKFKAEAKNEAAYLLSKALIEIAEGQVLDLSFEGRTTTTLEEVLFMYEKKTGALFEACALMGMAISNESRTFEITRKQREAIAEWARKYFNWRFQIHDDFIENNIDGKKGKPIGGDIKEGKVTPLFVETFDRCNEKQKKILLNAWGNEKANLEEIKTAIKVMQETGAVDYLRSLKDEFGEKGKELLEKVGLEREYEELLKDLTEFVGARPY